MITRRLRHTYIYLIAFRKFEFRGPVYRCRIFSFAQSFSECYTTFFTACLNYFKEKLCGSVFCLTPVAVHIYRYRICFTVRNKRRYILLYTVRFAPRTGKTYTEYSVIEVYYGCRVRLIISRIAFCITAFKIIVHARFFS